MTNNQFTAWDFIESFHPHYYTSSKVALANDLLKIMEARTELENGHPESAFAMLKDDQSYLVQAYGRNINVRQIQVDHDEVMLELYEEAIMGYYAKQDKLDRNPEPTPAPETSDVVTLTRVQSLGTDSTPTPPKVWQDNGQVEGQYYARKCDITGEGMYEGWIVNGGEVYIKYESDAIEYCRNAWNQTLQEAYDESEENGGDDFYHTSWEDDESDYQYRLVDGVLVDEISVQFQYQDEVALKQEYMTSTEEMQHRMTMVLDDLAKIREWAVKHKAPEEILVMFSNIEIACDIDDNECLTWSKYKD
jgi:hypothetical protein